MTVLIVRRVTWTVLMAWLRSLGGFNGICDILQSLLDFTNTIIQITRVITFATREAAQAISIKKHKKSNNAFYQTLSTQTIT